MEGTFPQQDRYERIKQKKTDILKKPRHRTVWQEKIDEKLEDLLEDPVDYVELQLECEELKKKYTNINPLYDGVI